MKKESNPKPPEGIGCSHKFAHLSTHCRKKYDGEGISDYYRIDRFFCERCLHTETKKYTHRGREYSDWWIDK